MKRLYSFAYLVAMLAVLAGCANFDTKLNTAAQIHAGATRSVATSLDAQLISSKDAEAFQVIAVKSSEILDSARELKDSDPKTAEGKLNLASAILTELNNYLLNMQRKGP